MANENNKNDTFIKDWKEIKRQHCEIYARIMGYLRPVSHYNIWKRAEFYSRKYFVTGCTCNREFINKYEVEASGWNTITVSV